MPVKPWALGPKKSLNIFGGLGEVLDARAERQQTLEDRLGREQDRSAQQEARTLEMKLKQAELDAMSRPAKRKIVGRETDPNTGEVFAIYDTGEAEPVRLGGAAAPPDIGASERGLPTVSTHVMRGAPLAREPRATGIRGRSRDDSAPQLSARPQSAHRRPERVAHDSSAEPIRQAS